jgi:hypothetical protein
MVDHPFFSNPFQTRADYQNALISLLDPLLPHFNPAHSLIKLGSTSTHYDEIAAQLEGWARPLWGLASLLSFDPEGYPPEKVQYWIDGFCNGPNPKTGIENGYWDETRGKDQRMVEMAPIGFALAVAGDVFWNKMSESGKQNLTRWLGGINGKEMPQTNWLWFRVGRSHVISSSALHGLYLGSQYPLALMTL